MTTWTCSVLQARKVGKNIEIGHFFQSRTFFHLSSNPHTSCLSSFNVGSFIISRKKTFFLLLFTFFHCRKILNYHIKENFKINIKQVVKMSKKSKYVNFKSFQRKIKSPFMIYADFESILVPEDNGSEIQMSFTKTCCLQLRL